MTIKLLFESADPVDDAGNGALTSEGLFESRQVEASNGLAHFMEEHALSSSAMLRQPHTMRMNHTCFKKDHTA